MQARKKTHASLFAWRGEFGWGANDHPTEVDGTARLRMRLGGVSLDRLGVERRRVDVHPFIPTRGLSMSLGGLFHCGCSYPGLSSKFDECRRAARVGNRYLMPQGFQIPSEDAADVGRADNSYVHE